MARHFHFFLILVIMAGCSNTKETSQDPDPGRSSDQSMPAVSYPIKLTSDHLPNPIRIHDRVISGGLPEGDAAFAELSRMGVKTIISVDGMTPDVKTASKYGLRYVHLPHGYNGIPEQRVKELAKAVRELDGPIYIHCHHGKHRSPTAASVACVSAGLIPPSQAISILKLAGTSPNYRGLFQAADGAKPMDAQELDQLVVEFSEVQKIPAMAEAMVHLGHADDHLKLIAAAGWKTPSDHPDLEPAHEALLARELFTELLRTEDVAKYPDDFRDWLRDSESAANELETELRARQAHFTATLSPKIEELSKRLSANCKACHVKYRDVPLNEEINAITGSKVTASKTEVSQKIASTANDPAQGEVLVPAESAEWTATLVHQSDVGIWTVRSFPILERYGCPEVVGLDDKGRCTILNSYSGKWTPSQTVHDGQWLGAIAFEDLDAYRKGPELYVAGKQGNLYQVWAHPQGGFDSNLIVRIPGREMYTLVAGDLDQSSDGNELLAFTLPGGVFQILPPSADQREFQVKQLVELPGCVRDAVMVRHEGKTPEVITVSRSGQVCRQRLENGSLASAIIFETNMGLGRIAVGRQNSPNPVFYVTCDDGRIIRLEQTGEKEFRDEVIYNGPQGPRGIVAGRFSKDPEQECVAVFGYSKKLELLSRGTDQNWTTETLFEDVDKGHWLTSAELDGRNDTEEILLSGYGGRIVLLARMPQVGSKTIQPANQ